MDIKQWKTDAISEQIKIIKVKQSVFFTFFFSLLESDSNVHFLKKRFSSSRPKISKYINKERREDMKIKCVLRGKSSFT